MSDGRGPYSLLGRRRPQTTSAKLYETHRVDDPSRFTKRANRVKNYASRLKEVEPETGEAFAITQVASEGLFHGGDSVTDGDVQFKPDHTYYHFFAALYVVIMLGCFLSALVVPLTNHGHWWWRVHWSIDGYQELSKRYELVTIVLPLGYAISFIAYTIYLLWSRFWASIRFFFYRDGIDYMLLFDTCVPGIPIMWATMSMCGLTNITELLALSLVFLTGHALLSVAEYYGYNHRMTDGLSGGGIMTWFLAFMSHVPFFILLPLDFKYGTRHHSTAAWIVLFFVLAQLLVHHVVSLIIVAYHSAIPKATIDNADELYIKRGGPYASFFRKDASALNTSSENDSIDEELGKLNWKKHIQSLDSWNTVRLLTNFICRLVVVISVLAGEVFMNRGEVVF